MPVSTDHRVVGSYWLLYYQPRPEDGERIAIAFVTDDGGKAKIHFDSEFSRVRKTFPATDIEGLLFVVESLRSDLADATEVPLIFGAYSPQIAASSPRKISLPISDEIVSMLLGKYILAS